MKAWEYHNRIVRERRAREAAEAVRAGQAGTIAKMADRTPEFELLMTAIEQECRRLSELPRGSERIERKRALLLEFLPVVEKYVVTGEEYRNPVLTQLMVWAFDVGDIDQAMRLARVAIAQNQPMPERYKRDVRTAVADLVMDWVESRGEQSAEPYFSEVYRAIFPEEPDVIGWQIHDEIRLKYVKRAIADAEKSGNLQSALDLCNFAEKIDPKKAQVKTRKAKLEKELAKLAEAARNAGRQSDPEEK